MEGPGNMYCRCKETTDVNPVKLSITIDGETKIFHDKTKIKQYLSTNTVLQKILEENHQSIEANYAQENTKHNFTPLKPTKEKHTHNQHQK